MILDRLENLPLGRFQYKLLVVTGLGWLFDAMDTGMVSFVLVTLAKEWGLSAQQSGWVVSIGFVGMALGAVLSGWAADRFGRRNVFAGTMVLYGAATGLCALSPNLAALLFFRFWGASASIPSFGLGWRVLFPIYMIIGIIATLLLWTTRALYRAAGEFVGLGLASGGAGFVFPDSEIRLAQRVCGGLGAAFVCVCGVEAAAGIGALSDCGGQGGGGA